MRPFYRDRVARLVVVVAALYIIYYLYWRTTSTLNRDALLFSLVFLAAEVHGAVSLFLFAFMAWDTGQTFPFQLRARPSVDILVPTYNEGLDILEPTRVGSRAITYPHTTYVLDDGGRPEVAELAKRLGCRYLTRPDNRHAKAGNLNAALERTDGEFIAVLDADMVPQPAFLDRTLGYFVDERVALVQLPQEFYNLDSLQHITVGETVSVWHDQALFFRLIQRGKNRWNAAFWCGSPSVLRRKALRDVGGIATGTVTEDIHTSVRLHSRGWKTVYHQEPLAFGVAPDTLHAFSVQRLRWAQGSMQLIRSKDNPLTIRGLTLAQRINYLASILTYFDSYQKLIFLLTPLVILAFGVLPIDVDGWSFVIRWVPYFCLGSLANIALGRGNFKFLEVELLSLLKLFTFIQASLTLVRPRSLAFRVTPKRADQSAQQNDRNLLKLHIYAAGLAFGGIILALSNLAWGVSVRYSRDDIVWITIFWSLINGGTLLLSIWAVWKRRYQRSRYRFPIRESGLLIGPSGEPCPIEVDDLSLSGAGVVAGADPLLTSGDRARLAIAVGGRKLEIPCDVAHARRGLDRRTRVGLSFSELTPSERDLLVEFLFVTIAGSQAEAKQHVAIDIGEEAIVAPAGT